MFQPNVNCLIHSASGKTDVFGMPLPGKKYRERCSIVKLNMKSEKSAVRADTSASRGNAMELEADTCILLVPKTIARIDDNIEVAGGHFRIVSSFPRFDLQGNLDHYEVTCTFWEGA